MVQDIKTFNTKNFTVHLFLRDGRFIAAEKYLTRDPENDDYYEQVGLWFRGNKLEDFDGAYFLPKLVAKFLIQEGMDAESIRMATLD